MLIVPNKSGMNSMIISPILMPLEFFRSNKLFWIWNKSTHLSLSTSRNWRPSEMN